jgi:hypothetical protein
MTTPETLLGEPLSVVSIIFGLRGASGMRHAYEATNNFYPWRTSMCATDRCDDSGALFYMRHG